MSKSYRREVAKKLKEATLAATDPMVIAELANVLAKYLPKPKSPRSRRGTTPPIETTEPTIDDMVAAMEKKRKGVKLSAEEHAVLNGESTEVA